MKFQYYPETNSLYIGLFEKTTADSREVADGVVVDFDEQGAIVGIDIDHASKVVNLQRIESASLPFSSFSIAS